MSRKKSSAGLTQVQIGLVGLVGTMQVMGASAHAQSQATGVQAARVDEVVVTAQRREERLVDVPVSVSAVSGGTLATLGVTQVTQLQNLVPGLNVTDAGPIPKVGMRGITLNDFGESNESPIALYVNDVYVASPVAPLSEIFDIDRVEVQRGPQGTLFGRNATGGLIQIITKKPTDDDSGYVSVQYGSFNQFIVQGAQNLRLNGNILTRTAIDYDRDDGNEKDVLNGSRFGSINSFGIRETIDTNLSSAFTDSLILHYGRNDSQPILYSFRGTRDPITHGKCAPDMIIANDCVTTGGNRNTNLRPGIVYSAMTDSSGAGGGRNFLETWGVDNTLKYAGKNFNITSVTAYESTSTQHVDDDAPTADDSTIFFAYYGGVRKQFSQEVRGDGDIGNAKWVAGVYYFHEDMPSGYVLYPNYAALIGSTLGLDSQYKQRTDSIATFAQADYKIIPNVTLTGGLRFTHEAKSLTITDNFAKPSFVDSYNPSLDKLTWKAGAKWQIRTNLMTYASVSTGFKAQAFNTSSALPNAGVPSRPETDTSYEVGLKGQTGDHRFEASIAAFHTDYREMQLVAAEATAAPVIVLINVPKADINGIEVEGNARPFGGLSVTGNVDWLQTKIHAPGVLASATPIDGDPLTLAPQFSVKGVVRYDLDVAQHGTISPWIDFSYRTKTYGKLPTILLTEIPGYALVDTGFTWTPKGGNWKLDFLVQNVINNAYVASTFYYAGYSFLEFGRQRTFAVKVTRNW